MYHECKTQSSAHFCIFDMQITCLFYKTVKKMIIVKRARASERDGDLKFNPRVSRYSIYRRGKWRHTIGRVRASPRAPPWPQTVKIFLLFWLPYQFAKEIESYSYEYRACCKMVLFGTYRNGLTKVGREIWVKIIKIALRVKKSNIF